MREYEIVYIFRSNFTPEEIEAKLDRYHGMLTADGGGEITAVEQWGKRQLAYPILKQVNGYYVVAQFTGDPATLPQLERVLKLDEDLLRYLIVLSEGELPVPDSMRDDLEPGSARPKRPDDGGDDGDDDGDDDDDDDDDDRDDDDDGDDDDGDDDDAADDDDDDDDDAADVEDDDTGDDQEEEDDGDGENDDDGSDDGADQDAGDDEDADEEEAEEAAEKED